MQEASDAEVLSSRLAGMFLFDLDPSRRTLERYWLKLNLFELLCRVVLHAHASTGRPILALTPTCVRVTPQAWRDTWLPQWWRFGVSVVSSPVPSSPLLDEIPHEMASELVPIPDHVDQIYAPLVVREWPLGREVMTTALVQSVDLMPHDAEGEMQALVRLHLVTEQLPAREFTTHDVFKVSLPVHGASRVVSVWARTIDAPERGVIVSGVTETVPNEVGNLLVKLNQQVLPDTHVALFRAFPLSSDLDSLAMLLLRSLVAPAGRDFPEAVSQVRELVNRMTPAVESMDPDDAYIRHTRLGERFREMARMLRNPGVPDELWLDGLILVARCLSPVSGFGFRAQAGKDLGHEPVSPIAFVLREVAHLAARTRVELFESEQREIDIQRACEQVLAEIDRGALQ
ncbi:MAG: hypothetical protein AB7G48_07430 [Nitrospiraceae bacterium]